MGAQAGLGENGASYPLAVAQPPMKIEKDSVVTLRYKVADAQGRLVEEAAEPMAYIYGDGKVGFRYG